MPSIIPGYEYDIFISYRQKDNKLDGWVTEFIQTLRNELDATFKEDISIYFDENPHDGLQEAHDVDQSLKEKVKCLVFIPIVSQTYCDPTSFAWQKEFIPFRDFATSDQFGLDIKVSNGNVIKRILPIRIHEIDNQDKELFEKECGGKMRSIDFIYQSAGVNRSLRSVEEHPEDNVNQTIYRDQINKVANAIKEIVGSMKDGNVGVKEEGPEASTQPSLVKSKLTRNSLMGIAGTILIAFFVWFFQFRDVTESQEAFKYDIAVMYLENLLENDETYANRLLNLVQINLAEDTSLNLVPRQKLYDELKKLGTGSVVPNQSVATELANNVGAKLMIIGRVIEQSNEVLVQVELIEVSTGDIVATKKVIGNKDEIFGLADNISKQLMQGQIPERDYNVAQLTTMNSTAYTFFYNGLEHFWNLEFGEASSNFSLAIQRDSSFAIAYLYKAISENPYGAVNEYRPIETDLVEEAKSRSGHLPLKEKMVVKFIDELLNNDSNSISTGRELMDIDPDNTIVVSWLSFDLLAKGNFPEALRIAQTYALRNPLDKDFHNNLAYILMWNGKTEEAVIEVQKYLELEPDLWNSWQSAWEIYLMHGNFEKALELAQSIDKKFPESPSRFTWTGLTYLSMLNPEQAFLQSHGYSSSSEFLSLGFNSKLMEGKIQESLALFDTTVDRLKSAERIRAYYSRRLDKILILLLQQKHFEINEELDQIAMQSSQDLDYNPFTFYTEYLKGINYVALNDFVEADKQVQILNSLIESKVNDYRFNKFKWLLIAEISLAKGNFEQVPQALKKAGGIVRLYNPRHFYINLQYLIRSNQFFQALEMLDNIHFYLGSGRPVYGGNQTQYTINLMMQDYHRGIIYEKMNEPQKALAAYSKFLELLKDSDPGIAEKEYALARLRDLQS